MKQLNTLLFLIILSMLVGFVDCRTEQQKVDPLMLAEKMALSEMKRFPEAWMVDFNKIPQWNYTSGLVCKSFELLNNQKENPQLYSYIKSYADKFIDSNGNIKTYSREEYNLDQINSGKILFSLYQNTRDPRYKTAMDTLRAQMRTHPRTREGGFWHKKKYTSQMWLDGIYMADPFLAQYSLECGEGSLTGEVIRQIQIIQQHTYDPKTGLNFHGWDESKQQKWANPATGQSPNIWGRAMGWYCMALVDILDYIPANHPQRNELISILKNALQAVLKVQDSTSGVWYQVPDQGNRKGNYLESTCSCMFTYALLKSSRLGYVPAEFKSSAFKAYNGIVRNFIKENTDSTISLTHCCSVAGLGGNPYRDGSFGYYIGEPVRDNDPKGVGPFIMASVEMHLAQNKMNQVK